MQKPTSQCARNAQQATPQERARICDAIRRQIALEYLQGKVSKREVWARMAIGLPPRTPHWEQCR